MNPIVTYVDAPYTLDKTSIEMDAQEEETLTLTINPEYDLADEEIEWTAAMRDRGTHSRREYRKVKGLAAGQTIISAKIGAYEAVTCEVTINAALQNEFTVDPESLSVKKGESGTLTVTVSDKISVEDIEVAVEDDTIATASLSGTTITVTGVKKGNTKLYITAEGSKSATVEITVTDEGVSTIPPPEALPIRVKRKTTERTAVAVRSWASAQLLFSHLERRPFVLTRKKK